MLPFDWVFIVYRAIAIHMTHRFVTYNNSYGYGLYLSKPGIDATTNPDPDNFLLHSNFKQEQVLTAGYVSDGTRRLGVCRVSDGATVAAVVLDEFFHGGVRQSGDAV